VAVWMIFQEISKIKEKLLIRRVELDILASGQVDKNVEMEYKYGQMGHNMKVNGGITWLMARDYFSMQTVTVMRGR